MSKEHLLSSIDLTELKTDSKSHARLIVASKLGNHFDSISNESSEYQIACEIAYLLQNDKEVTIRIALAESVKHSEAAPKQLILQLCMDRSDEVAVPILRNSPLINDSDLMGLLPTIIQNIRLIAVAERKFLSVTVSSMLAERNIEEVVVALLNNDSAIIDEEVILQIAYKHSRSQNVLNRMMRRMPMPTSAVSHMVKMQQSGEQLNRKPNEMKSFTSLEKDELKDDVLTLMLLGKRPSMEACAEVVDKLESEHKISAAYMLLAMCLGHEHFFINYMSQNTHLPRSRVEELCRVNQAEFSLLMNKSGISPSLYGMMYHTFKGMKATLNKNIEPVSKEFALEMVEHLIKAETAGVNFATTIGKPLAKAIKETFA